MSRTTPVCRPAVFVSLFFAVLLLVATPAQAQPRAPSSTRLLGIAADTSLRPLAGAPPSKAEPLGTLMVAWCEGPTEAPAVRLGEWSLHASRWLSSAVVKRVELCPRVIHLAWSRQRLVMALGYDSAGVTELRVFERHDATLMLTGEETFENAEAPSLDADANVVALATYERRAAWLAPSAAARAEAPVHALHVRLLDPSTLRVLNARVFFGDHLLRPAAHPEAAGHAVRLVTGQLQIAIAEDAPREVTVKVPSLAGDSRPRTLLPDLWPRIGVDGEPFRDVAVHGRRVALRPVVAPGAPGEGASGPVPWAIRVLP